MKMRCWIKEKIAEKGHVIGAFVASGSPNNCEIMALNGFDFIVIDTEHAQTESETIVDMVRASELYGMSPLIRVYSPFDGPTMSRMLDVGLHGVMVPLVNNPEQAKMVVDNTKYAPIGHRGANGGRGPRWGAYENYIEESNDNLLTIVQCESIEGLENVEEIAAMPGIDCIFVGTGDLTLEMGLKFKADTVSVHNVDSDRIVKALDRVLKACKDNGKIPGIVTMSAEDAARRINQGFQLVTCMNDLGFFKAKTKAHLDRVNELIEK